MPESPLTADPKLISVEVGPHPDAVTSGVWCVACTRGMLGFTPIDACVTIEVTTEFLPADFFSGPVADAVLDAYTAAGHEPVLPVTFPPVAQDTTVWDPETNAPYP